MTPSLVVGLVSVVGALDWLVRDLGPIAFEPLEVSLRAALGGFLLFILLRGYIGAVVATELRGRRPDSRAELSHAGWRLLPLIGTVLAVFTIAGAVFGVAVVSTGALVYGAGVLNPGVFDGLTPTLLFGPLIAIVAYRFWLAPDACVVGSLGPIASLRWSWTATALHWRRMCALFVGFLLSLAVPSVFAAVLTTAGGGDVLASPGVGLVSSLFQWLTAVVWYCVGVQIYVRSVLT